MSERESDKGSLYKQKLWAKAKNNKESTKKSQNRTQTKHMKRMGQLVPPEVHARLTERMSQIRWGSPARVMFLLPLALEQTEYPRLNKSHNKMFGRLLHSWSKN